MNGVHRRCGLLALLLVVAALAPIGRARASGPEIAVASKNFTESVILGEILAQAARSAGAGVTHRRSLGGTRVCFSALVRGQVDAYVEYTGTIAQEILPGRNLTTLADLRAALEPLGLGLLEPIGFNNTYAIGMRTDRAEALGIRSISDLASHPALSLGFNNEFMNRADGWPGLRDAYGLTHRRVRGLEHDLAYKGLVEGAIDATDLFSTDAEIQRYSLKVLADDRAFFPRYDAVVIYRLDLEASAPDVVGAWRRLSGSIDDARMTALNAAVKVEGRSEPAVAAGFLLERLGLAGHASPDRGLWQRLRVRSIEHAWLVAISLSAAIVLAVPLGVAASRLPRLGQSVLGLVGILQTVPSLAMLVFMIPLLGIGARPAVAALLLYSLLPIVRNTHAGLTGIPAHLIDAARAIGLSPRDRLLRIELPLALPSILAGIKTAAVINVGTATLGALIGAGGFGQPILTGIRLDDVGLILQGAIPAAAMALGIQWAFDLVERAAVPRGLRLGSA